MACPNNTSSLQIERSSLIDYLRKSSEAIILLVIVASPWAFGAKNPPAHYFVVAGIALALLFWAIELIIEPKAIATRFQIPLIGLVAIAGFQLMPLGSIVSVVSPNAAKLQAEMMPDQVEVLADGAEAEIPFWTARNRVSFYPAETMRRAYWMLIAALLFTRIQDLASVNTLRRLCLVCLINGSILSYFAVFQHFTTKDPGKIYWTYQSLGAAFGPFVNRNHFAFYINICFGLSLGLVGSRLMGKVKSFRPEDLAEGLKDSFTLWMVSVLVFMLGALILCSSRGGLISLFAGTLITAVFVAATGSFQQGWKWFALAAGIFAIAAGVQIWLGFDFVDSRYAMHTDNRSAVWVPLLSLIPQFPLLGTGLGTLAYAEPLTRISTEQRDVFLEYAHNEYLQVAVEMGLMGLFCGVLMLVLLFSKIAKRIRTSRHNAWLYVGSLFSLSVVSLHSFAEFGPRIPAIAVLAVALCGHIAGLGRVQEERLPKGLSAQGVFARLFAVCLIIFIVFAVRNAKSVDLAERYLLQAQRAQKEGRLDDALAWHEAGIHYTPNDVELLLDHTELYLGDATVDASNDPDDLPVENPEVSAPERNAQRLVAAQQELVRVRELCPMAADPHSLIGRHLSTFAQTKEENVIYYDRALKARPADPDAWYAFGRTWLRRGDTEKATQYFHQSLALSTEHLNAILTIASTELDHDAIKENLLPIDQSEPLARAANWFEQRSLQAANNPSMTTESENANELVSLFRQRALDAPELVKPKSGDLWFRKAELHRKLEDSSASIAAYQRAVGYEPQKIAWRLTLAELLGNEKRYDEAHRQIKRILGKKPDYNPAIRLRDRLLNEVASGSSR